MPLIIATWAKEKERRLTDGEGAYFLLDGTHSSKKVSKALLKVGYVGISYPAEARSGGREDGARNYVIFNESDSKIVDHVRFFRTSNDEAYGFTVGGMIYKESHLKTPKSLV